MDTALRISSHPHDLKLLVQANGRLTTSMDDLEDRVRMAGGGEPESSSDTPDASDSEPSDASDPYGLDEMAADPVPSFPRSSNGSAPPPLASAPPPGS